MFSAFFVFLFSSVSMATNFPSKKVKLYYFELVPKEKFVLTVEADKYCPQTGDLIKIHDFESSKSYGDVDKRKSVPVRIKNYFVDSISPCSQNPSGKISEKIVIGPFKDKMTHIRVVVSDGMTLTHASDCGAPAPGTTFDSKCNLVPVPPPKK